MLISFITKHFYSIKSSLKFGYLRKQSQYLYLIPHVSHFLSSCPNSNLILCSPSDRLLRRFDKELAGKPVLSINSNM